MIGFSALVKAAPGETGSVREVRKVGESSKGPRKCYCGKGHYQYGSALYDYYSCGHAFEKPLGSEQKGRWVNNFNPYRKLKG